jgi:hypothetical protein
MTPHSTRRLRADPQTPRPQARRPASATASEPLARLVDPRQPWLVPALVTLISRLTLGHFVPFASEDAYITFRYARHLANGHGLVYNPGQRVFGFSSPLWTFWSALGFWLTHDPVRWARLTNLAADLIILLVMGTLLSRQVSRAAAWCFTAFYATWPYFTAVSVSGMECTSMLALIAVAAMAASRGSLGTGPALAAVALIRPEGIACAAVLSMIARWRDRLVAAGVLAAVATGFTLYFGSPVPQSLTAKSLLYGTPGPWVGRHWWEWLSPVPLGRARGIGDTEHLFVLGVVLTPAIVLGVRALWSQRRGAVATVAAACLVVWLGYVALGVAYFWWYLLIPLAGFLVLAAVGFPRLARGPALYASTAFVVLGMWGVSSYLYLGRAYNEIRGFGGVTQYLVTHVRPGDKVMAEPIGMLGYRAPVIVVDEVGLVSPQVARRRLEGPGWYADVAGSERPDWLVMRRGFLAGGQAFAGVGAPFRSLAERDSLLSRYAAVTTVDTVSGDLSLVILRRRQ